MKRDDVVAQLTKVLKPGTKENWRAGRAARHIPRGLEPAFVRRAALLAWLLS